MTVKALLYSRGYLRHLSAWLLALLIIGGCGGSSPGVQDSAAKESGGQEGDHSGVMAISVSGRDALVVGDSVPWKAEVEVQNGVSADVTWSSTDPTVATVNANGLVSVVGQGSAEIVATSVADASQSARAGLTVVPTYETSLTDETAPQALAVNRDGHVVVAGTIAVNPIDFDGDGTPAKGGFVHAFGADGTERWRTQLRFDVDQAHEIKSAVFDAQNNLVVVGHKVDDDSSKTRNGFAQIYRYGDASGGSPAAPVTEWVVSSSEFRTVVVNDNGSILVAGKKNNEATAWNYDSNGWVQANQISSPGVTSRVHEHSAIVGDDRVVLAPVLAEDDKAKARLGVFPFNADDASTTGWFAEFSNSGKDRSGVVSNGLDVSASDRVAWVTANTVDTFENFLDDAESADIRVYDLSVRGEEIHPMLWHATVEDLAGNHADQTRINAVAFTPDNEVIVGGETNGRQLDNAQGNDWSAAKGFIQKYSADGEVVWTRALQHSVRLLEFDRFGRIITVQKSEVDTVYWLRTYTIDGDPPRGS